MAHVAVPLGRNDLPAESYLDDGQDPGGRARRRRGPRRSTPATVSSRRTPSSRGAVTDAGLAWIGPPPEAISTMGDKIESRRAMLAAGVRSCRADRSGRRTPTRRLEGGERSATRSCSRPRPAAAARGSASCATPAEIESAFRTAAGEAQSAFGDGRLYMERYLDEAAPHRGAGAVRPARERRPLRRARVLDPAPPPEVDRGVPRRPSSTPTCARRMGEVALRGCGLSTTRGGHGRVLYSRTASSTSSR